MTDEWKAKAREAARKMLPSRLLAGAKVLGRLHKENVRCSSMGWSVGCTCGTGETEFCDAKRRWMALWVDWSGLDAPAGPYAILEAMSKRQFEASGLTVTVELPGGARVKIGAGGASWDTIRDLAAIQGEPEALTEAVRAVLEIQRVIG